MKFICEPAFLKGDIGFIPPSKSIAHRALMLGAMSGAVIRNVDFSKDIMATLDCLNALGAVSTVEGDSVRFSPARLKKESTVVLNCGESGSTLRFFIPFSQALGNHTEFRGEGRLPKRPLTVYFDLFDQKHISFSHGENYLPLTVSGKLSGGVFQVRGDISSQFITGLMLSAPLFECPAVITVTGQFESKPYVDITLDTLRTFGVAVREKDKTYEIANRLPTLKDYTVEKDWSQAAFFLCGGAINGDLTVKGMNLDSKQGDKKILEILKDFHADLTISDGGVHVRKSYLRAADVDVRDVPDLVPVLAVLACFAEGTTRLYNAARLRLKESDRLSAMYDELTKLGAVIAMGDDYLEIQGGQPLHGGEVFSHNDHRIAMALSVCSLGTQGNIILREPHCTDKSYPAFYQDFIAAGGVVHESY